MSTSKNVAVHTALNYLLSPYTKHNLINPIEQLSSDEITQLQKYLEQIKKSKMEVPNNNNSEFDINPYSTNKHMIFPKNRATDIYDPLKRDVPIDWRQHGSKVGPRSRYLNEPSDIEPGERGSTSTRNGKRSQQDNEIKFINDRSGGSNFNFPQSYFNPYEYGARQEPQQTLYQDVYNGSYTADPVVLNHMGLPRNMHQERFPTGIRNVDVESSLIHKEPSRVPGQKKIMEKEYDRFNLLPFDPQDHTHIVWKDDMPRGGYSSRIDRTQRLG